MIKIAPSVLSADFMHLNEQLTAIEKAGADWLHFDVMDGHFVPNLTFGPKILTDVRKATKLFLDVHIMVEDPGKMFRWFKEADLITFHYEAVNNDRERINLLREIQASGMKAGISVKPHTAIAALDGLLADADLILIMSVEPGFGGQRFMMSALDKVRYLAKQRQLHGYGYQIEIDGGINSETAPLAAAAGADILVAGSYIFNNDIAGAIGELRK